MGTKNDKKEKAKEAQAAVISARATIIVALIGLAGTLIGVLFDFQPFSRLFDTSATATLTITPTFTLTATETTTLQPSPTPTFTFTLTETLTPTATFTQISPTATFTPTPGLSIGMQVKITANQLRGNAPLNVTLSAKDSFVRAPDGNIFECRRGGCSYIWYVYLNGEQFIEPQKTGGTLELKLGKRGNYFVSVYICHGADAPTCGSGGTVVIVE